MITSPLPCVTAPVTSSVRSPPTRAMSSLIVRLPPVVNFTSSLEVVIPTVVVVPIAVSVTVPTTSAFRSR